MLRRSALVFALDAAAAGQQPWRQLARQAALRGTWVAGLEPAAYGGWKDVSEAWAERIAIMLVDGGVPHRKAARLTTQHATCGRSTVI
jgi:hypothetical protein